VVTGKRVHVPMADCFAAAFAVCCQSIVLQPSMDGCITGGLFGSCMADCFTALWWAAESVEAVAVTPAAAVEWTAVVAGKRVVAA
jgi:hypothetical protein